MKRTLLTLALYSAFGIAAAHADNLTVERALERRPELSNFYTALMSTGVNKELQPGRSYTVFAPVNAVFAQMPPQEYPCLYDAACRPQIADIVRNHIVPGEIHLSDATKHKGGIYSIDQRFIAIGEPSRNNYAVEGNRVLSSSQVGVRTMLHEIDGVIAQPAELALLRYPVYPPYPYDQAIATSREYVRPDPSPCLMDGCPQAVARTTETIVAGPVMYGYE